MAMPSPQTTTPCGDAAAPKGLQAPVRNRFYHGKQMGPAQFQREQRYHLEHRWLINRLAIGSGVLCGLELTDDLVLQPGVALDGYGREIIVPQPVPLEQMLQEALAKAGSSGRASVQVELCYAECCVLPTAVPNCDPCHPMGALEYDAIQESYRVEIKPVGKLMEKEAGSKLKKVSPKAVPPEPPREAPADTGNVVIIEEPGVPRPDAGASGDSKCESMLDVGPCTPPQQICVRVATVTIGEEGELVPVKAGELTSVASNQLLQLALLKICEVVRKCCGEAREREEPEDPDDIRQENQEKKRSKKPVTKAKKKGRSR